MTTARDIITSAMRKIGAVVMSETISDDEAISGLASLNAMLSMWSNESMTIYARVTESFPLTATSTFTIGSGQTFNTVRPIYIAEAHIRQSTIDYPLTIIPDEVYNDIAFKNTLGTPQFLNYDNGFPTGNIRLFPVPDASYTLYLLSEKELSQFTIDQDVSFPPGWELALIYNLAILLAPEYGQPVSNEIYQIAKSAKASIQTAIAKNRSMDANPANGSRRNIYNGYFN